MSKYEEEVEGAWLNEVDQFLKKAGTHAKSVMVVSRGGYVGRVAVKIREERDHAVAVPTSALPADFQDVVNWHFAKSKKAALQKQVHALAAESEKAYEAYAKIRNSHHEKSKELNALGN